MHNLFIPNSLFYQLINFPQRAKKIFHTPSRLNKLQTLVTAKVKIKYKCHVKYAAFLNPKQLYYTTQLTLTLYTCITVKQSTKCA